MLSQRQFFKTIQTCEMLESAIRQQFPGIKGLMVFLDRDVPASSSITVKFDEGTCEETAVLKFIETMPTYIQ